MTLIQNVWNKLQSDVVAHLQEILILLPAAMRFTWLVIQVVIAVVLTPIYGIFGLSLYLWGEAGLDEKLTLRQKVIFWSTVIPASAAQWYLAVLAMNGLTY